MKRKKLLVVGSIPDESNLLNYGGATVLMKNYLDYLASQSEYEYRFVQNNRYSNLRTRQRSMWRNYSYFFPAFLWRLFGCDIVMFNFSDHGTIYYFPLLSKIARLAHKKVVLRKFGGSFEFYIKKIGQTQLQRALDAIRMATNNGYPKLQPIHPIFHYSNLVLLPLLSFAEDVHSTGFHPQSGSSVFYPD